MVKPPSLLRWEDMSIEAKIFPCQALSHICTFTAYTAQICTCALQQPLSHIPSLHTLHKFVHVHCSMFVYCMFVYCMYDVHACTLCVYLLMYTLHATLHVHVCNASTHSTHVCTCTHIHVYVHCGRDMHIMCTCTHKLIIGSSHSIRSHGVS